MPDHAPSTVAELLVIAPETLRKWAREFAPLLSAGAQGGKRARRMYQDPDVRLLREAATLLNQGLTYQQVRDNLQVWQATPDDETDVVERDAGIAEATAYRHTGMPDTVVVLDQQPEVQALRQLLDAQRATLEAQQMIVASQSQVIEQQRAQLDALERGLQAARADEALALAELRRMIGKIPRWLRALLGLGL